jgi:hypothetical protein
MRGVAIFAKACFGHPSPSKRQKLNATANAFGNFYHLFGQAFAETYEQQMINRNYSAAENYRNITLRAVMIFYSPIGSRDSKIS